MNRRRALLVLACALAPAGCGINLDVSVANVSDRDLRVELVDVFANGESAWLSADVAKGRAFTYRVRDGWRADRKFVRVLTADGERPLEPLEVEIAGYWSHGHTRVAAIVKDGRVILAEPID